MKNLVGSIDEASPTSCRRLPNGVHEVVNRKLCPFDMFHSEPFLLFSQLHNALNSCSLGLSILDGAEEVWASLIGFNIAGEDRHYLHIITFPHRRNYRLRMAPELCCFGGRIIQIKSNYSSDPLQCTLSQNFFFAPMVHCNCSDGFLDFHEDSLICR